jgi:hypothetical protein
MQGMRGALVRLAAGVAVMVLLAACAGDGDGLAAPDAATPDSGEGPAATDPATPAPGGTGPGGTPPGDTAPANPDLAFTAPTVDGGQLDASALDGRDVVLWFWAPW